MPADHRLCGHLSLQDLAEAVLAKGNIADLKQLAHRRRMYATRPEFLHELGRSLCDSAMSDPVAQRLGRACWHLAANRGNAAACLALWWHSLRANRRNAFARAWPILARAAHLGSVVAMRNIMQFRGGNGAWRTTPNMLRYLEVLVDAGDPVASRYLAQAWDEGWLGLPKDSATAFEYFLKAAKFGDGWSQYCVATQYAQGCGVEQNDELAVFWYQKAADQGVGPAQSNLGFSHEIGRPPLTRSMGEANRWYRLAAINDEPIGKFNLAQSYRYGKGLPVNPALAHEWYLSAAQDGHSEAAYCAARGYELGLGVVQDWTEALRWFAYAAKLGNTEALQSFERLVWRVEGATEAVVRNEGARQASQDVCAVIAGAHGTLVLLADGAGGGGYGEETAESLRVACQERVAQSVPDDFDWANWLEDVDHQLASGGPGGQSAAVLLWLSQGVVSGASVGNSQAWLLRTEDVFPLTALQASRPLLGSGKASVTALGPCRLEGRLVVASDGLWQYVSASRIESCVRQGGHAAVVADRLITAARLPNGQLADDVSLIVILPLE